MLQRLPPTHRLRQHGQAIVEYLLVTLLCVVVLVVSTGDGPVIGSLKDAIKGFFKAFSFAISVTPQCATCLP